MGGWFPRTWIDSILLVSCECVVIFQTMESLCLNLEVTFTLYSKNPHKRTSGLRTLRLEFVQKDTICIRTPSA